MLFIEKLIRHQETFKQSIRGGNLASNIDGYVGEHIVDYYGAEYLIKMVSTHPNSTEFASFLFLDALFNSTAHANGVDLIKSIKRNVIVLNTHHCFEGRGNLSHRRPQMVLGLKKNWSEDDVAEFEELFRDYVKFHKELMNSKMFKTLKHDPDLANDELQYKSFGIVIDMKIMTAFHELRKEVKF